MGIYRKHLDALTADEREAVENDLLVSNDKFSIIADKHHMFETDVRNIAITMGLIEGSPIKNVPSNISSYHSIPVTTSAVSNKTRTTKKKKARKPRHDMTEDDKIKIAEELEQFSKNSWIGWNSKAFIEKYDISSASLSRIAKAFDIILPGGRNGKIPTPKSSTNKDKKEEEDKNTEAVEIKEEKIINLDTYINSKVISVKLDSTVFMTGVNFVIYNQPISKMKNLSDYEAPIKVFFDHLISGKKIHEIKVYTNTIDMNFAISALFSKYCYLNKCNLTFVAFGKEQKLITDFDNASCCPNLDWLCSKYTIEKYLYNMEFNELISLNKIWFLNLTFKGKHQIICCSSYEELLNLFYKNLVKAQLDGKTGFIGSLKILVNGIPTEILNFTNEKIYT